MKTTILLIRHGETEWNKTVRFQGQTDIPLCDVGIRQAELVKDRLQDNFDLIYTSPLSRAYETAKIIASNTGKEPIIHKDLIEINFGPWEGLRMEEVKSTYHDDYIRWKTDKLHGNFTYDENYPKGEKSIHEVSLRFSKAILGIVESNLGKTIAVVAHGGIMKAGIIGLFQMDMTMYHKLFLNNTSISTITFDEDRNPMLLKLNDHTHLEKI